MDSDAILRLVLDAANGQDISAERLSSHRISDMCYVIDDVLTRDALTTDQLINLDRFVAWFKQRVDGVVRHQNN